MRTPLLRAPALLGGLLASSALAVTNPYTETFSSAAANWSTASVFTPLTYPANGGPDGTAYGSGSFGFASTSAGGTPILFRATPAFASSSNAFFGDWLGSGVTSFTFSVRHNAPVNIDFFARFTAPMSGGVVALQSQLVPANTWTTFTVPINASTPFIYEGAPTLFGSTFANVANVQIGFMADAAIAGQAGPFTFDVDNVSITPAPGAAALFLGAAGLAVTRRRRTR